MKLQYLVSVPPESIERVFDYRFLAAWLWTPVFSDGPDDFGMFMMGEEL